MDFYLKKGDLLPVVDASLTLNDSGINAADVATVKFAYRREGGQWNVADAEVLEPNPMKVRYEWEAGDTDKPGSYIAEWRLIYKDGGKLTLPNGPRGKEYITFEILGDEMDETPIADLFGALRHLLQEQKLKDASLLAGVQAMVRLGEVPGYKLNATRQCITPAIEKEADLALLLYKTVRSFVAPRPDKGSFKSRGIALSHGSYRSFLDHLDGRIDELENGSELFHMGSGNSFGNWLTVVCGLDVYASGLARLPAVEVPETAGVYLCCGGVTTWPVERVY